MADVLQDFNRAFVLYSDTLTQIPEFMILGESDRVSLDYCILYRIPFPCPRVPLPGPVFIALGGKLGLPGCAMNTAPGWDASFPSLRESLNIRFGTQLTISLRCSWLRVASPRSTGGSPRTGLPASAATGSATPTAPTTRPIRGCKPSPICSKSPALPH